MHDDETVVIPAATATRPSPPRRPRLYAPDPRRGRRLYVELDRRAAVVGGYPAGRTFTWCPVPFLAVRWTGSPRVPGLVLGVAAVLSVTLGLPAPWNTLLALWLAVPAAAAFWHAWRAGRLW